MAPGRREVSRRGWASLARTPHSGSPSSESAARDQRRWREKSGCRNGGGVGRPLETEFCSLGARELRSRYLGLAGAEVPYANGPLLREKYFQWAFVTFYRKSRYSA